MNVADVENELISGIDDVDDVMAEWNSYVAEERERELAQIIGDEKLREPETRKFLENAFRDGEIKTTGIDIDRLMPPVSRFGGGARDKKKQTVIDKLKAFFERFFGIGASAFTEAAVNDKVVRYADLTENQPVLMVAEEVVPISACQN